MIVKQLTGEIGSKERDEAKRQIVLEWTAEHGFSSIEVLSRRIGQSHKSTFRFFQRLLKEEYLRRFRSPVLPRKDLVILGRKAAPLITSKKNDYLRRIMRADVFAEKLRIVHDYKLQEYLVLVAPQYGNILHERSIICRNAAGTKETICPDALLSGKPGHYKTNYFVHNLTTEVVKPPHVQEAEKATKYDDSRYLWVNEDAPVAVEFERTAKEKKPFYRAMQAYFTLVRTGRLKKVIFIVEKETTAQEYQDWLAAQDWPEYAIHQKTGTVYKSRDKPYPWNHPFRACVEVVLTENYAPGTTRKRKQMLRDEPKSEDFIFG